ncbi:MAG: PAS domain S-box protein [Cyanobium sp. PLM2.Bin73]|nr:MAG: PAS domain S-box protein [Cyanobium sp. PLM2.Bin73]
MWTRALALAGLTAVAVLINLNAPTLFFDLQLMLGTAVAVLALLLFGWTGLVVGAAALAVTVWRWGHPVALLIGLAQLVWLGWFLDRRNGGRSRQEDRLVLAAIAYGLLVGVPASTLLLSQLLGVEPARAFALGLLDGVVAVLCTAMGLAAYLLWQLWHGRHRPGGVSLRSLIVAWVVLAVSLPWMVGLVSLSGHLKTTVLKHERQRLQMMAALVTLQVMNAEQKPGIGLPDGLGARWRTPDGGQENSDPALFARLEGDFVPDSRDRVGLAGLELLVPRQATAPLPALRQSYWLVQSGPTTVVKPAWPLINTLNTELMLPRIRWLGITVLVAVALAELLARVVDHQLGRMLRPLQKEVEAGQATELAPSVITELQEVVVVVNERARQAQELSLSLQRARDQLAHTCLAITESIPVGTYTTLRRPGETQARFAFLSDRFLEICGLERNHLLGAEVIQAFRHLLPEDQASFVRLEQEASSQKRPFKGEGRMLVNGMVRWLRAESVPRDLPDGSTLWEGVLTDVTEEVKTRQRLEAQQQQLRRILDFLPVAIGINRLEPPQEIVFQNRRFQEIFGYSLEEIPNVEVWRELAYDDPEYRDAVASEWEEGVQALASGGTLPPLEVRLLSRDRSRHDVIIAATRLDELMLVTFLDVTESKQASAALEEALRRESTLKDRQRRELEAKLHTSLTAAAVAHEINQPLSALLINTQMLQAQVEQLPAGELQTALRPLLEQQLRESERIVETIERMRMLLRNVRTDQQPIDLCEVVESARLVLAGLLASQGVTLEQSGLDQPHWLLGDGAQLQIAVANLVRNAVEALEQAGVKRPLVRLSLERRPDADGREWLELRIADNGSGFSEHQRDQLLLASTKAGGSGIGLFVATTAVENHGGQLQLGRSPDLGGAEVLVRLPALAGPQP